MPASLLAPRRCAAPLLLARTTEHPEGLRRRRALSLAALVSTGLLCRLTTTRRRHRPVSLGRPPRHRQHTSQSLPTRRLCPLRATTTTPFAHHHRPPPCLPLRPVRPDPPTLACLHVTYSFSRLRLLPRPCNIWRNACRRQAKGYTAHPVALSRTRCHRPSTRPLSGHCRAVSLAIPPQSKTSSCHWLSLALRPSERPIYTTLRSLLLPGRTTRVSLTGFKNAAPLEIGQSHTGRASLSSAYPLYFDICIRLTTRYASRDTPTLL